MRTRYEVREEMMDRKKWAYRLGSLGYIALVYLVYFVLGLACGHAMQKTDGLLSSGSSPTAAILFFLIGHLLGVS